MPDLPGRDPRMGGGDGPPAKEARAGYPCRMRSHRFTRLVTRRRALTGLAAAAAGGAVSLAALPFLAGARSHSLDYPFTGPAPDRGLGFAPPLACTPGTRGQTAGPFYTPGTPRRSNLREPGTSGEPLVFEGLVLTPDCWPLGGAVVDIWHCDEHGRYDNDGFRYRGHQFTDAAGAFRFETIRPKRYRGRTAHIHVHVQGEATRLLTTQVYFPDLDTSNARDFIFRDDLVMRLDRPGAGGVWRGRFDFVLALA